MSRRRVTMDGFMSAQKIALDGWRPQMDFSAMNLPAELARFWAQRFQAYAEYWDAVARFDAPHRFLDRMQHDYMDLARSGPARPEAFAEPPPPRETQGASANG